MDALFHCLHLLWLVNDKNSRGKQFKGRQKKLCFDEFLWLSFWTFFFFFEKTKKLKENEESVNVCEAEKEEFDS